MSPLCSNREVRLSTRLAGAVLVSCIAFGTTAQLLAASPTQVPAESTAAWIEEGSIQARLSAGEVVMRSELGERNASVEAAIRVRANQQVLWKLITSCDGVSAFVPGMRRCERLKTADDGSWAIVEHDIRYSALMPMIRSIVRSQYQAPHRIDFTGVGGNVKEESGSWVLEPAADGRMTTVEYSISIEPGFLVPRTVVRHSLSKELPVMLTDLRARAEQLMPTASLAAPHP